MQSESISVKVEKSSEIVRKLTVKVPAALVTAALEQGFEEVRRGVTVKGFRKGTAPIGLVKQQYGDDVRHRAFHKIIEDAYEDALQQEKIQAIGSPKIETPDHKTGEGEHDHGISEGKDLTFTATIEVLPKITIKGYDKLSLVRSAVEVKDEDVTKAIEGFRESLAQFVPAESGLAMADGSPMSRPAEKKDYLDIDFAGEVSLKADESGAPEYIEYPGMKGSRTVEIGSGDLIPGFEDELIGMRKGETKTFSVNFPEEYGDEVLKAKPARFTVTVKEIKTKKLPELNDDFAKTAGFESLELLQKKAREQLLKERTLEADKDLRSQIFKQLIEKNEFECPQGLIRVQSQNLAEDIAGNLKQQGYDEKSITELLRNDWQNLVKQAESQVRSSLILDSIAEQEKIEVTAEELEKEISTRATLLHVDEKRYRDYLTEKPAAKRELEYRLREERVISLILNASKVKAKSS